jgi:O-antigen/teichoic acid export membrane protein
LATIFLYALLEPFINWWIGKGYLLGKYVFIFILVNFYIGGMRGVVSNYKNKAGLFVQDKYAPVFEGLVNLIVSIILMNRLGLVGVFMGTTISTLLVPFWNQPRILYKNLFKRSVWIYFRKYIFYLLLTLVIGVGTSSLCNIFICGYSFISLCARGIICLIVPNIIYLVLFYKTEEFKYLLGAVKVQLSNISIFKKVLKLN